MEGKTVRIQLLALDSVAGTYGQAPTRAESEVSSGEWTYFVLEKAGRRPVPYLCTSLSLEGHVMKKVKTCWRRMRARTACRSSSYFGMCGITGRALRLCTEDGVKLE